MNHGTLGFLDQEALFQCKICSWFGSLLGGPDCIWKVDVRAYYWRHVPHIVQPPRSLDMPRFLASDQHPSLRAQSSKPCALLDATPVQHLDWKKVSDGQRSQRVSLAVRIEATGGAGIASRIP